MTTDQTTAPESEAQEEAALAAATWKFVAVADTATVTKTLRDNKAKKANVAFAGKETAGKRFGVWYVPSMDNANKDWKFTEVAFTLADDTDTQKVTDTLKGTKQSTVTFAGQDDKYYVWWRK